MNKWVVRSMVFAILIYAMFSGLTVGLHTMNPIILGVGVLAWIGGWVYDWWLRRYLQN